MSLGYHSEDLKFKLIHNIHIQKNVEPVCHSLHVLRPWNCPIDRNEQRRKPHDDEYNVYTRTNSHNTRLQELFKMQCIYTPQGVPVALFLTSHFEFSRFLERQNQSVQLRLLCICPHPYLSSNEAFSKSRCANIKLITDIKQINI